MKKIILLSLLCIGVASFAQTNKWVEEGDEFLQRNLHKDALASYANALNEDLEDSVVLHVESQMASAYYDLFDYENAENYHQRILEEKGINDPEVWMRYGHILRNIGKYNAAKSAYEKVSTSSEMKSRADFFKQSCNWALDNTDVLVDTLYHLTSTNLATGGRSLGVTYFKNGLIYSRPHPDETEDLLTEFYDISYAERENDTISHVFNEGTSYTGSLNKLYYEGTPSVTSDGTTLYFSGNASERKKYKERKRLKKNYNISAEGVNILKIYTTTYTKDSGWVNRKELPFCSIEYNCTHPSITKDGNALYFASDMPGGLGGYDIYVSLKEDTTWGTPKNLGPEVNTPENEMTPFVMKDKLYFSSKGRLGFGGSDIYIAKLVGDGVDSVNNMGQPINSSKDDFAFVLAEDDKIQGYLSSNREGSKGYDNIYAFERAKPLISDTIKGIAINKVNGLPISGINVMVSPNLENTYYTGTETDDNGEIELIFPRGQEFLVTFSPEGFEPKEIFVPADNREDIVAMFGNLEFDPKVDTKIVIENIYFDFDKSTIRDESLPALNKILEYMNSNAKITVELSAHTDCRGSDSYNKRLSQRRAESTLKWLTDHGVAKNRMTPVGYGETQLVNKCDDGVSCTAEEHFKNRRVELKVLTK